MTDETPNWDALPGRPAEFFGLEANADPDALKRAYTRLIRRFKPERHPQEFRRIRAAYEQLEAQLRYGDSQRATPEESRAQAEPSLVERARVQPLGPSPLELVKRLGPRAAFEQLKSAPQGEAPPWFALALIADALSARTDTARRIAMKGLAQSGGAPEMLGLVELLLRGVEREPEVQDVLLSLAKLSAGAGRDSGYPPFLYWYLTQRAWQALCEQNGAEPTLAQLARCAAELGPQGRTGELLLKLRLRRTAALSAEESTLQALDSELSENLRHLPPWAEAEYDAALWLARYRETRDEFRSGDELREKLDAALSAIVEGDDLRADRAFFAAMLEVHERTADIVDTFPHEGPTVESDMLAIGILEWYSQDWRARRDTRSAVPTGAARECADFFRLLESRGNRSLPGRLYDLTVRLTLGVLLVLLIAVGVSFKPVLGSLWPAVSVALGAGLWFAAKKGLFNRLQGRVGAWILKLMVRRVWRPETALFLARTRIPIEELIRAAHASEGTSAEFPAGPFEDDPALELISLAAANVD